MFRGVSMKNVKNLLARLIKDEQGATAVEYGMMVALIAAVIVAVVKTVGTKTNDAFQTVNSALP
jgi:pilus assembly protein Flp/PilA